MSVPNPPVIQDDDGPEEGEIEDDEDDIILLDGSSPHRSSTTSTSLDVYPLPTRKDSYERDIRHFELRRSRISRRRTSGASKSTHSMGSSLRSKPKNSRTGLTEGKENRHVHRHTSPARVHRHRKESSDNALADYKDVSPLRRDSSCSSVDSDERSVDRATYYRSTRKSPKTIRGKRKSSSSPESSYIPSKRRSHHLEKCPLMKVLHSVAKETRLIAMENSESHPESSSLRQRLLNMGAMSSIHEEPHSKGKSETSVTITEDANLNLKNSTTKEDPTKQVQNGSTQTEESVSLVNKSTPEVVVLTDSEEVDSNEQNLPKDNIVGTENTGDLPANTSDASLPVLLNTGLSNSVVNSDNEDDDDISHLRLLALQSKKHEPTPPEDADVLQLRLAALKTAFIKKLKIRKKISIKINTRSSKEDPLSPLDEIPAPFSVPSPDEVMTPVDMELAETDDEDASVDSVVHYSPSDPIPDCYSPSDPIPDHFSSPNPYPECYSPSDPTGSPILETSLQDLLPPPPPPDLDLIYADQTLDSAFENHMYPTGNMLNSGYEQSHDVLTLPPLPPYFQQLLSEPPELCVDTVSTEQESLERIIGVDCSSAVTPIERSPNLIEIPVISDCECSDIAPSLIHSPVKKDEEKPIPVAVNPPKSYISEAAKTENSEMSTPSNVSLEEEEKMLRQRLLLNMARKRESLDQKKKPELESVSGKNQGPPKAVSSEKVQAKVQPSKKVFTKTNISKVLATANTESPTVRRSTTPVIPVPALSIEKRIIVNLGEDSDSCEDYSEAEALGQKCIENQENWLLHLKELEVNPPKMISPGNKLIPVLRGKAPSKIIIKAKQPIKGVSGKKPFAENLADLESSVERFLKGVRSSQEAISKSKTSRGLKSVSSNGTPVAVKHLPASQQEEYRRLKQQIATLEKQRQMTIEQKRAPQSVSIGTQITPSTVQKNNKLHNKASGKAVILSDNRSKIGLAASAPKNDSKVMPASGSSLKKPVPTSLKNAKASAAPQTSPKVIKAAPALILSESVKGTVSENSPLTVNKTVPRESPVIKGKTALANVSNLSVPNLPNPKTVLEIQKASKAAESGVPSLSGLEENLIVERSHVLSELSALAKLLSQVDQSLEAQSQTAGEVSSLIDKLCLAAGRWKAQNATVTHLVQKVAQRQKELSLRHRRCVALSKSCTQLGSEQVGKNYRSPGDNADAMHLQLKQVHEKTQDLARRKTAERTRRNVLEKRAEECLMKLFSDMNSESSKGADRTSSPKSSKASTQEKPSLTSGTVQIASIGPMPSSKLGGVPSSSLHEKNTLKVNCLAQVNPAMISKAMSLRLALNKVRHAKSTLNAASQRSHGRKSRMKYKRKCLNTPALSVDVRQDLSDMDISTDGEEVERRNKHSSENTEVVDMLVSPGSSLGPPETELLNATAESNQNVDQNPKCIEDVIPFESFYEDIIGNVNGLVTKSNASSVGEETGVDKKTEEGNTKSASSARNILKDYISPLNGLNVSSCSKEKFKEGDLDPYAILCPYDLNGKCEDTECQYKHQHQ